jgi:hypothetical protein
MFIPDFVKICQTGYTVATRAQADPQSLLKKYGLIAGKIQLGSCNYASTRFICEEL